MNDTDDEDEAITAKLADLPVNDDLEAEVKGGRGGHGGGGGEGKATFQDLHITT